MTWFDLAPYRNRPIFPDASTIESILEKADEFWKVIKITEKRHSRYEETSKNTEVNWLVLKIDREKFIKLCHEYGIKGPDEDDEDKESKNGIMIIDSHVHISTYNNDGTSLDDVFDLFLKEMKNNNVDAAIIIPDNVEGSNQIVDLERAIKLISGHRNLFLLGSPQIIQRGASELEKYQKFLEEGKIKGIKFFPGHDPYYPTDERCLPYYELCEKLDVPVLFHTGENSGDSECAKWNDPKYIVEIAKKYQNLKVIITHYYWPKLDYCYETTKDVPNIYFETAAMADEEVIEKSGGIEKIKEILKKTISDRPDKVIFGTDWPMCKIEEHIKLVKQLGLDKNNEEKIFSGNANRIYKLSI